MENKHFLPIDKIKHIQISMGNLCNQLCSFCYQDDHTAKNALKDSIWKESLAPVYPHLKTLTIIGGEPTIMKNARALATMIYDDFPNIRFQMITNGKAMDQFWKNVFLDRGEKLSFSVNAASKDTYNKIVTNGNWDSVIDNMKDMVRQRKERKSSVQLHAGFVVTSENFSEIIDFIDLCRTIGIERSIFGLDFCRDISDRPEFKDYLQKAYEYSKTVHDIEVFGLSEALARICPDIPITIQSTEDSYYKKVCPIPFHSININMLGDVSFCCAAWLPLGNLKTRTIEELWNSSTAIKMRKLISSGNYSMCKNSCSLNCNPANTNVGKNNFMFVERSIYFLANHPVELLEMVKSRIKTRKIGIRG
jgi:MoaA/NifB/PqqE/SkfB family radical SAM enzyme